LSVNHHVVPTRRSSDLAWDVTGKSITVLRAGWGMFYDSFSQDIFLGHLPYPPFFDPGPAYNPDRRTEDRGDGRERYLVRKNRRTCPIQHAVRLCSFR